MPENPRSWSLDPPAKPLMKLRIERMAESDRTEVIDLFNYYIENTFAAYPEEKVPYALYDQFLKLTEGYPAFIVRDDNANGSLVGFAFLRAWHPASAFLRAAEVTWFIEPSYTNRRIGSMLLEKIISEARKRGVDTILANVSSLNEPSLRFHRKHGFTECGRFRRAARKKGKDLDAVWMQLIL